MKQQGPNIETITVGEKKLNVDRFMDFGNETRYLVVVGSDLYIKRTLETGEVNYEILKKGFLDKTTIDNKATGTYQK